ncbi:MAG TPA: tetratricopeptide repeat protein, partial [Candidatus Paceibacterota bacterium]|nr:tetratricopeptide repeat protein [Candidatus Paceibacterota bacterium]
MKPHSSSRIFSQKIERLTMICVVGVLIPSAALAEAAGPRLYPTATLPLTLVDADDSMNSPSAATETVVKTPEKAPAVSKPQEVAPLPLLAEDIARIAATNKVSKNSSHSTAEASSAQKEDLSDGELSEFQQKLEKARYLRTTRQVKEAEPMLVSLLEDDAPEKIQQAALLELAVAAQDENDLARAQQIYAQFLHKWPNDLRVPEILLRQGLLFRRMGLNNLALTKFYGVMTSALVLQNDQLDYYVKLVQQAQVEIAETHYELGKYAEAADFFSRLLKQANSQNKSAILYKLTRCHFALDKFAETVADAQDYLSRYSDGPEQPEIRFHLAVALSHLGRDNESLQQVLLLMREQRERTKGHPEVWAYWQQRAGNLIGNHLYREGDYAKALDVYLSLARLDPSPNWQLPVN